MSRHESNPSSGASLSLLDWTPFGLGVLALALVCGHLAFAGAVTEHDEGAAAHLWQLLMAANLIVISLGAVTRLRTGGPARWTLLAAQLLCTATATAAVILLHL